MTRWALEHLWAPVGTGVRPQAETDFVVEDLFGGPAGLVAAREMDGVSTSSPAWTAWASSSGAHAGPRRRGRAGVWPTCSRARGHAVRRAPVLIRGQAGGSARTPGPGGPRGGPRRGQRLRDLIAELLHQRHRRGVLGAGADLDDPVADRPLEDVRAELGADHGERPAAGLAEPSERDVGVLGREVRTELAPRPRELVRLLQREHVLLAVLRVEEQPALDVHADQVVQVDAQAPSGRSPPSRPRT